MAFGKRAKLGIGGAALALASVVAIGSTPAPTELPTVTVWHSPT